MKGVGECTLQVVQFSRSVMSNSLRPHESQHARPPCPSPTLSQSSLRLMSIESVMPSSHLILCRPLFLLPKYWSFSVSIIPSKEIPGLISFRMDWLDLLAVQRNCKGKDNKGAGAEHEISLKDTPEA